MKITRSIVLNSDVLIKVAPEAKDYVQLILKDLHNDSYLLQDHALSIQYEDLKSLIDMLLEVQHEMENSL